MAMPERSSDGQGLVLMRIADIRPFLLNVDGVVLRRMGLGCKENIVRLWSACVVSMLMACISSAQAIGITGEKGFISNMNGLSHFSTIVNVLVEVCRLAT